jgi:hypothetical protein
LPQSGPLEPTSLHHLASKRTTLLFMNETRQLPAQKKLPKNNQSAIQTRIARTLFCSPEFAQIPFRDMNLEDWKVLASRAWEVAGAFVEETKRHKK